MVHRHKRGVQNGLSSITTYNLVITIVSAATSHREGHLGKALSWTKYFETEYLSYRHQQHGKVKTEEESSNSSKAETVMVPPSHFSTAAQLLDKWCDAKLSGTEIYLCEQQ